MVMNYLQLMLDNGFVLPKSIKNSDESHYNAMEMKVAIRLAFNQMTFIGKNEEGLQFKSSDKKEYLAEVSESSIICSLDRLKTAENLECQKEFSIIFEKTGNFSFERLMSTSKGMLIVTIHINDGKKRQITAYIKGYDSFTMNLFKEWLKKEYSDLYITALEEFCQTKGILPDISRAITVSEEDNNLKFSEDDLVFDFKSKIDSEIIIPKTTSLLSATESIIRAKKYFDEMEHLGGLSYSMEEKIAEVLLSQKGIVY